MLPGNFLSYLLFFVPLLSFGFCSASHAGNDSKIIALQQLASQKQLWTHPEWPGLLHYNKSGNEIISQVDDTNFFNASEGKSNPEAEMLASIEAFYNTGSSDDSHPQCRFPARLDWLNRHLNNQLTELPVAQCTLYKEWRASMPDEQLTLVFPAYHLNSPSSMFGHTLLRLDPANLDTGSEWLSIAVNFGADVKQGDNSLFYAFKGLSGGYPGFFIVTPYFKKIREYNRDENRDIWEYSLNLQPDEIEFMVTHLWELKEIKFDYYFFDENCSYRLLELLEVARPGIELTDEFSINTIPVDTVRAIEKAGLIKSVTYRPSQVTVLQNLLATIPDKNQPLIERLASNPDAIQVTEFQTLDSTQQKNIVDATYKFLRYQQGTGPRDEITAKNGYRLLEQLNLYPASTSVFTHNASQPETGHLSRRASITLGSHEQTGFVELGYRMSFHGLEDNTTGFLQGAQINLGNLELRAYENESVQLQRLDLVDIFSLTPRSKFFTPLSWRIYTGMERQLTNNRDILTAHVTGGAGIAYAPIENNLLYFMASLRLENNSEFDNSVEPAPGALAGMLHHFKNNTAHLQLSADEFTNNETRYSASYIHNFVLATNHSVRLNARRLNHENAYYTEASVAYQYYF